MQRFQLVAWPDDLGKWKWIDRKPDATATAEFCAVFLGLYGLACAEEPLAQSPDALLVFQQWYEQLHFYVRENKLHPAMESHFMKMPEAILSLALLNELADNPNATVVDVVAMQNAVGWYPYLRSQFERLYHLANSPEVEAAKAILSKRQELEHAEGFTAREVSSKGWAGIDSPAVAASALELLVDLRHLYAVQEPPGASGGRPTTRYFWRPGTKG